jgi:hypothetical protein
MVSIIMAIIVLYFNFRMLKLNEKDRERPRIVEIVQFCIVPVKERLTKIDQCHFREFNLWEILRSGISRGVQEVSAGTRGVSVVSRYSLPPSPDVLCANFYALLERLNQKSRKLLPIRKRRDWKSEWDEKVRRFNDVQRKLSQKMEELGQRLEKFIGDCSDIEKIYGETDAKNYYKPVESFKRELADPCKFYDYYKQAKLYDAKGEEWSLAGAWFYAGKEVFYRLMRANETILAEIDKLMEERERARDGLVAMLDEIRGWLEKEYKLTPSEQIPAIELPAP